MISVKNLTRTDSAHAIFLAQCLLGFWLVAILAQIFITWSFKKLRVVSGSMVSFITTVINVLLGALAVTGACFGIAALEFRQKRQRISVKPL